MTFTHGTFLGRRIDSKYLLLWASNFIVRFKLIGSNFPSWVHWNSTKNFNDLKTPRREDLSYQSIIEYFKTLSKIYWTSDKIKKTNLLNHAVEITGFHRKSILRNLSSISQTHESQKSKCGAKKKYDPELLLPFIKTLWISMEKISPIRMKAALKDWLPSYKDCPLEVKLKLEEMSASTLARFIKQIKKYSITEAKGLCSTSPARYMKNKVPINTLDSKIVTLGFVQADTVAHCGDRLEGSFINSLTFTDIFSTWTENRALYTKKAMMIKHCLVDIEKSLPFSLKAINTDSGSEFLNVPVYNHFKDNKIQFTRSRPYKKNDNCFVEQKNFTHVREIFGYQRFEEKELVELMNDIYKNYWNPLQNYFLPSMKLKEKIRIGAKIYKKYDRPQTAFDRIINSKQITEESRKKLFEVKDNLNPFELKYEMEKKLTTFFSKVNVYNLLKRESNVA